LAGVRDDSWLFNPLRFVSTCQVVMLVVPLNVTDAVVLPVMPLITAEIVVVPPPCPVARPPVEIEATAVLDELHVADAVTFAVVLLL
jgi:hypothetical protein